MENLKIPRHYINGSNISIVTRADTITCLVGFSDSSEKAYSAVVYLCKYKPYMKPVIALVSSKTRVAPIKPLSMPQLELNGAVLVAQLISTVHSALKIKVDKILCYSDSLDIMLHSC